MIESQDVPMLVMLIVGFCILGLIGELMFKNRYRNRAPVEAAPEPEAPCHDRVPPRFIISGRARTRIASMRDTRSRENARVLLDILRAMPSISRRQLAITVGKQISGALAKEETRAAAGYRVINQLVRLDIIEDVANEIAK